MVNGNKYHLQSRLSLRDALFRPSREPQNSNPSDKIMKTVRQQIGKRRHLGSTVIPQTTMRTITWFIVWHLGDPKKLQRVSKGTAC
jgi:hypothetical protein